MTIDPDLVRHRAQQEFEQEAFRAAVEAEKVRLRARQSLWHRLTSWLPFTITIKRKS